MGQIQVWDEGLKVIDTINISCAKALSQTINNAAAVDATGGLTRIPITGHGYLANSYIYITGSVAYNGLKYITAKTDDTITIRSTFVAETFAGSEVTRFVYYSPVAYEIAELKVHLSAAPSTSENLVITCDSGLSAAYDTIVLSKDLQSIANYIWVPDQPIRFSASDLLVFTYTNTDTKTIGIQISCRRIAKPGSKG
jgi:hypothetical protein